MKKSNLIILIIGILIIVIGAVLYKQNSNKNIQTNTYSQNPINQPVAENPTNTTPVVIPVAPTKTPVVNNPVSTPKLYTASTVATHNSKSSCWTIVNNNVYDITSYISQHPGGEARIMSICGIDGTSAFKNQHGGQTRPENTLAKFLLGPLQ